MTTTGLAFAITDGLLILDHPSKAGIEIPRWDFGIPCLATSNHAVAVSGLLRNRLCHIPVFNDFSVLKSEDTQPAFPGIKGLLGVG